MTRFFIEKNMPVFTLEALKIAMSQNFAEDGTVVPVTLLKVTEGLEKMSVGEKAIVTGISKGKGFAGVVKRYRFAGGPKTHGQSDRVRAPGSIGAGTDPGRVWKGTKMAGRMGHRRVTVKGLEVVEIDHQRRIIKVKGAVPGATGNKIRLKIQKPK